MADPVRLIIFDCDGVLVDSEPLAMRMLLQTLEEQGLSVSEAEAYERFLGRSLSSVRDDLRQSHQLELGEQALHDMRDGLFALYREELQATAGLAATLQNLPGTIQTCVASSSAHDRIRISLDVTDLLPFFEGRIFSATDVANGKPAPDLFLHAAEKMGVPPENCLVIEDSTAGIAAARAAGMRVFAFTGGTHIVTAGLHETVASEAPDHLFDDMADLPDLLAETAVSIKPDNKSPVLVAVDVGTASVRAGIFEPDGRLLARAERPIHVHRSGGERGLYASDEIWRACCDTVRQALDLAGVDGARVAGIGFDATCSLVVLDGQGCPLDLSDGAEPLDTIAWFDHRALAEAAECTALSHEVLRYSGGVMNPEMEVPKLMWLKRHRPDIWEKTGYLFDLADFLTWKASGALMRSQSTLTAKWTFLGHDNPSWRPDFFEMVGLEDLLDKAQLPGKAALPGDCLGKVPGSAASDLGIAAGAAVATGLIDAHAGALGVLGRFAGQPADLHRHLGLIAGTSSCITALSAEPRPIHGVWGPYFGAVLPGVWLNEGGQSATGALLDHIIRWHAAGGAPTQEMHGRIIARIGMLRTEYGDDFAKRLHVLPDFHGNRSPLAEPDAVGVLSGLDMDSSFDSLCRLYWRTAVGIALGLRHILEALNENGYGIDTMHVTGGHTHNPLLMELYADATGCNVVTLNSSDAVLLGCAMNAASAAGLFGSLPEACESMRGSWSERKPDASAAARYQRDYEIFLQMHRNRQDIDALLAG